MSQFDGNYDYTKPWASQGGSNQPNWTYNGPWSSNMERLTQQALMVATIPGVVLQEMVRPPLPQIQLFPDRFGYGDRKQPGIDEIVVIDRKYAEPRVSWFSGGVAGYQAAERNALGSN